jgi:carboxypeptidase T
MARPYHYHVYHRPAFDALPAWSASTISVPGAATGATESKTVYSLKKDMDQLRADGAAKGIVDAAVTSLGTSTLGNKELWALKVGNGSAHKVLFTGCHHAREWISVEIPYLVAEYLIQKYTNTPTTLAEKRIKHLLSNRQVWFVPLANPDGHDWTMTVDRNWRPNRKSYTLPAGTITRTAANGGPVSYAAGTYTGVDINRNYATKNWGTETFFGGGPRTSRNPADSGADSIWCGLAGSGERESSLIDALVRAQKFRASITYHSFSEFLLFPDSSQSDVYTQWVGNGMKGLIAASGHAYEYKSGSKLYPTSGSLMEFSYEKVPGRPTFTPEVRPDKKADPWPKGPGFSGLLESEIGPTFQENLGAALALINCAGHNAAAASQSLTLTTGSPPTKCQMVRHCWEVFRGWTP